MRQTPRGQPFGGLVGPAIAVSTDQDLAVRMSSRAECLGCCANAAAMTGMWSAAVLGPA